MELKYFKEKLKYEKGFEFLVKTAVYNACSIKPEISNYKTIKLDQK